MSLRSGRRLRRPGRARPGASKATSVFLLPGRNAAIADQVSALLEALGLHVGRWSEAIPAVGGPLHAGSVADEALSRAQAVVALLSGDAPGALHRALLVSPADEEGELAAGPTPEFLLELGEILGRASGPEEERVVLVRVGEARVPALLERRGIVELDGTARSVQQLVLRLRDAGCRIEQGAASEAAKAVRVKSWDLPLPLLVDGEDPGAAWSCRTAAFFRLGGVAAPPPLLVRQPGVGAASGPLEALAILVRELGLASGSKMADLLRSTARLDAELSADPNATSDAGELAETFARIERVVSNAVAETASPRERWAFRLGALLTGVLRCASVEPGPPEPRLTATLAALDDHVAGAPLSPALARSLRRLLVAAAHEASREALADEAAGIEQLIGLAAGR
ncbi:MAG: hypothetical protein IT452_23710 [Planctomycetia bacterium]|nr:hypothetical protein [Planctomycetia bacterium]